MEDVFNKELCNERHKKLDADQKVLFEKHDKLDACISKKFNQIMFGIITMLLALVGGLMLIIAKMPVAVAAVK